MVDRVLLLLNAVIIQLADEILGFSIINIWELVWFKGSFFNKTTPEIHSIFEILRDI